MNSRRLQISIQLVLPKAKNVKTLAGVDFEGNLEFGGRHRNYEWRKERKAERKAKNKAGD